MEERLTLTEISKKMNVTRPHLEWMVRTGRLPVVREGGHVFVLPETLKDVDPRESVLRGRRDDSVDGLGPMLTLTEAAERLGIGYRTVLYLVQRGNVKGYRVNGLWSVRESDIPLLQHAEGGKRGHRHPAGTVSFVGAARALRFTRQRISQLAQEGRLEAIGNPIGKRPVITLASLGAEIRNQASKAGVEAPGHWSDSELAKAVLDLKDARANGVRDAIKSLRG